MLLCALHKCVRVGIQVRRSRTGIRNDLVEHVLLLKRDGNAHGVEQFTEFGQLLVGCGRILNQLGCALAEHKRRVRHHADHRGVRTERTLQLGEGHACGNGYNKRLLPFIFRQIRQDFIEILRLDGQQHDLAFCVDLGIVTRDGVALGCMSGAFFLAAVEHQHLLRRKTACAHCAFRNSGTHVAGTENTEFVFFHVNTPRLWFVVSYMLK